MKTLDELAIFHQTDRASVFTRTYGKPHDYARHYDEAFSHLRDKPIKMVEIGVGGGEGIKMWLEYFTHPEFQLVGVDIVHDTNPWDIPKKTGRYEFVSGDQGQEAFWNHFKEATGSDWDVIIDDGSHVNTDIITTFLAMWPTVKIGGFYCIEDLRTSYDSSGYFVKPNWPSQMEFLKGKLDSLNHGSDIDSIHFSRELAIIKKA